MNQLFCADGKVISYDEGVIRDAMNAYANSISNIFAKITVNGNQLFFAANIVGEYAELIACSNLNLRKEAASRTAYDAIGLSDNKTYQIKSRWMNSFGSGNGKNEFGRIKLNDVGKVDYLVLVVFLGDDFNEQELYVIDLHNDLQKIIDAYNNGVLKQKIVSLNNKTNAKQYIFKYQPKAFAQAVQKGLIKQVTPSTPASVAPVTPTQATFNQKFLEIANAYLREGLTLMGIEKKFGFKDEHGNTAKRILNSLGIDTSRNGNKGALIGKTVSDELANPGINAKYRATLMAIQNAFGD